jgi:ubiquitin carboxyl-terminal hydrolase 25/28
LIVFAYERQIESDADNAPYYLECLQGIAKGRDSEELQTKAAIEASSGKISLADVRDAYRSFGLEFPGAGYDDDTIVGNFQSRVADAPRQEPELRRALSIIGRHRQSTVIQHVASNSESRLSCWRVCASAHGSKAVTTYEQALSWLNATEDMDDGFLLSMFGVKVSLTDFQ